MTLCVFLGSFNLVGGLKAMKKQASSEVKKENGQRSARDRGWPGVIHSALLGGCRLLWLQDSPLLVCTVDSGPWRQQGIPPVNRKLKYNCRSQRRYTRWMDLGVLPFPERDDYSLMYCDHQGFLMQGCDFWMMAPWLRKLAKSAFVWMENDY